MKCLICNEEFSRWCSLGSHISRKHKIALKEYYDTYIEPDVEHKCQVCGKEIPFDSLQFGYKKIFCSSKCYGTTIKYNLDAKKKREETCLRKFGAKTFLGSKCFDRSINYGGTPESIAKIKATKLARYGNENYNNMEKNKQTKLERHGDLFYSNREQAAITRRANRNVDNVYILDIEKTFPYSFDEFSEMKRQMSSGEKKLAEFLFHRKISFKYRQDINDAIYTFSIYDNDKLCMLIDFNDDNIDRARPTDIKFIICNINNIEDCFSEILDYYSIDYKNWIGDIEKNLPLEFPYPVYETERMESEWVNLCENDKLSDKNYVGHSIIRNFHKSIWSAHVGNSISALEAWNDRKCIDTCVRNRVIYSDNLCEQTIVEGLNVAKIAPRVTVFRASLAKNLIQKYLSNSSTIFDPFSGFSGRMLGACALGKKYIGQDINFEHVKESNQIIKFLNLNATVIQKDIFKSEGEYECLFTCSPYNLKERWNDNETDLCCDDWIDECLNRFKCKRYLFVVDKTEKYKDNIVEQLGNTSHFSNNNEYVILIEK